MGFFDDVIGDIGHAASSVWDSAKSGVNTVVNLPGQIINTAGQVANTVVNTGGQIINRAGNIIDKVTDTGLKALDSFSNLLGSPILLIGGAAVVLILVTRK